MRSHPVQRILMMLLIALLIGVVAAPAEARKPRRYEDVYLVNWEICPKGATLTIGAARTDTTESIPVDVDVELQSNQGTSLLDDGPKHVDIPDLTDDEPIDFFFLVDNDEVTDDDPSDSILQSDTISHRLEDLRLVWSHQIDAGAGIRLGFTSNNEHKWGRFRVGSCEPPPPDGGGAGDNSTGVTTPGTPVSTEEIRELTEQINRNSETGSGPGGSRVPRVQCTIAGTAGDDRIEGTRGNDVICGFGGDDVIDGAGGLDVIDGANGDDRMRGGSGDDALMLGLRGNDRLNGNGGDDRASGGAGVDRLRGSFGDDFLSGGSGDDRLTGGKDRDHIRGGAGSDRLDARDRTRDMVSGGSGLDSATVDRPGGATKSPTQGDHVRGVEQQL